MNRMSAFNSFYPEKVEDEVTILPVEEEIENEDEEENETS